MGHVILPHFILQGLRINAITYTNVLDMVIKPRIEQVAGYAPSHTAHIYPQKDNSHNPVTHKSIFSTWKFSTGVHTKLDQEIHKLTYTFSVEFWFEISSV